MGIESVYRDFYKKYGDKIEFDNLQIFDAMQSLQIKPKISKLDDLDIQTLRLNFDLVGKDILEQENGTTLKSTYIHPFKLKKDEGFYTVAEQSKNSFKFKKCLLVAMYNHKKNLFSWTNPIADYIKSISKTPQFYNSHFKNISFNTADHLVCRLRTEMIYYNVKSKGIKTTNLMIFQMKDDSKVIDFYCLVDLGIKPKFKKDQLEGTMLITDLMKSKQSGGGRRHRCNKYKKNNKLKDSKDKKKLLKFTARCKIVSSKK